jgi:hypothetical protein
LERAFSAPGIYCVCNPRALPFGWGAPLALEARALVPEQTVKKLECARPEKQSGLAIDSAGAGCVVSPLDSKKPVVMKAPAGVLEGREYF